jgi:hypothetical protein
MAADERLQQKSGDEMIEVRLACCWVAGGKEARRRRRPLARSCCALPMYVLLAKQVMIRKSKK